jgi:hypothetical protein
VVSLFHIISKEREWRQQHGRFEGFDMLQRLKPVVAVGADKPLADEMMTADFFRECVLTVLGTLSGQNRTGSL